MALMIGVIGCGNGNVDEAEDISSENEVAEGDAVQVEIEQISSIEYTAEEVTAVADNRKAIKIAVVGTQEKDILSVADSVMKTSDYKIELVECSDYTSPAELVANGEVDGALCMNQVYIDSYNKIHDTDLTIKERIYLDPLAIFPGSITDMNFVSAGFKVAVQEGEVSVARALYLLEQKGLLEVDDAAKYQATMSDVTSNPYNISIETVNVENGWPNADEYGLIICDYNRALIAGIDPYSSIGEENRNSGIIDLFAVGLVVKQEKLDDSKTSIIIKAVNSEEVENYMSTSFYRSVMDYK